MSRAGRGGEIPEVLRYTKYYEHDGMLRAYANRAMLLAFIFGLLAAGSLGFAIYVSIEPPTVIRIDKDGNASVVGGRRGIERAASHLAPGPGAGPSYGGAPTDLEGRARVRQFLGLYLAYTPDSVDQNLAEAMNMMTANLRLYTLDQLRQDDTVGKIKSDHVISEFLIRSIEPVKDTPWGYTVFGVKELHHLKNETETTDEIVGQYHLRLVETNRSETNPSGLLVADYGEQEMVGEKQTGLKQESELERPRP